MVGGDLLSNSYTTHNLRQQEENNNVASLGFLGSFSSAFDLVALLDFKKGIINDL